MISIDTSDPIGAAWLISYASIELVFPLYISSSIGGRRQTYKDGNFTHNIYQESARPLDNIIAHLQFHLRHEVLSLELLVRLFEQIGPNDVQAWVNNEPTGRYARRTAFLYEWLTNNYLEVPSNLGGNYVDAIDAKKLVTSSAEHVIKNAQWRINDNLAGTRNFCPMLVKTEAFMQAAEFDIATMVEKLNDEFGQDLLMRASVWMTLRESKASFAIEGEGKELKRIERFADVMARRTGEGNIPLDPAQLAELQQEILGSKTVIQQYGLRQSPVFVSHTQVNGFKEIVHYIAPPSDDIACKLQGLQAFMEKTQGQSALIRSAVASFAFVYIHPLADGNGRVHRFLINDVLRRDKVIHEPIILPISQAIAEHPSDRYAYDKILDSVSVPLMKRIHDHYDFDKQAVTYPDGIRSNLNFENNYLIQPAWRFMDLSPHVQYLSGLIAHVIEKDMHKESQYLRQHDTARKAIKEIFEMPNSYADRIIRSMVQNRGAKSNKLLKDYPFLTNDEVWDDILSVVMEIFKNEADV
ncbi:Fic family protein [Psychrobacter sp. CAL346-MNA-CIBAN-0220]|uniref:Fic family protein n=1 Tax=Psychrobacter sp. CAL346-MNA-CIBAN-0220 TaxID=3140457 RepID=UPI00332644B7